ncbi:MAG: CBS domain-containing protein [Desulfobulbaceae bacterium]|nr:CBS domain-containing protein [Desulfobulbaceae bacterium]
MTATQQKMSATVAELIKSIGQRPLALVSPQAALPEIIQAFAGAAHTRLVYVVDTDQHLLGAISLGNLSKHLLFHHNNTCIDNLHLLSMATSETAADFIDRPVITAHLTETIEPVLERMLAANIKEIPILDDQDRLVNDLTMVDILHLCILDILP